METRIEIQVGLANFEEFLDYDREVSYRGWVITGIDGDLCTVLSFNSSGRYLRKGGESFTIETYTKDYVSHVMSKISPSNIDDTRTARQVLKSIVLPIVFESYSNLTVETNESMASMALNPSWNDLIDVFPIEEYLEEVKRFNELMQIELKLC